MNTTSKWGGLAASFFIIVCFGAGMAYAVTEGDLPTWFAIFTGISFVLGTLSGVICLAAALIGHLRQRHKGNRPSSGEVRQSPA